MTGFIIFTAMACINVNSGFYCSGDVSTRYETTLNENKIESMSDVKYTAVYPKADVYSVSQYIYGDKKPRVDKDMSGCEIKASGNDKFYYELPCEAVRKLGKQ